VGVVTDVAVSTVVPAVAPPSHPGRHPSSHRRGVRGPLPVVPLVALRTRSTVYGMAAVDDRGRLADHVVVQALGWRAGTRLDVRIVDRLIVVAASVAGVCGVTVRGHVRLPVAVWRGCGIDPGDRVLLAAEPADGLLVVCPVAALDAMLTWLHGKVVGGDPA
jgi:hypothetical protein